MIDAAIVRVLLEASLRVCFVALAVAVVLKVARVQSSSVRHAAWTSVVIAMLLMPALPYVVPSFELPGRWAGTADAFVSATEDLPYVGGVDVREVLRPGAVVLAPSAEGPIARTTAAGPLTYLSGTPRWVVAAVAIYGLGLSLLLLRWIVASRAVARLRCGSTAVAVGYAGVFESASAVAPITVGVLRPWIVLPLEWREWSADKLAAVIAHERAHIQRHDPLLRTVAFINRSIFWFHPLAWWLERKLAATAEHACDDAAVRAIGGGQQYAEVLLDMAALVERRGGRVAWEGIGVNGNGLFTARIDRLLRGDGRQRAPFVTKLVVVLACLSAIGAAASCRYVSESHRAAVPGGEAAAVPSAARKQALLKAQRLTAAEADALESRIAANSQDVSAREELLTFYGAYESIKTLGAAEVTRRRRSHALWMIEHQPSNRLTASLGVIPPAGELADPEGWAAGRQFWLAIMARTTDVGTLTSAMSYFTVADLESAKAVIDRGQASGVQPDYWRQVLGRFYALEVAGARGWAPGYWRESQMSDERANDAFARGARAKLEISTDPLVIASAASELILRWAGGPTREQRDIAAGLVIKLKLLEPDSARGFELESAQANLRTNQLVTSLMPFKKPIPADLRAQLNRVEPAERLNALPAAAMRVVSTPGLGGAGDAQARQLASDALQLAATLPEAPHRSSAVFQANLVLGTVAVREGNVAAALQHLEAAVAVPPSREFADISRSGGFTRLAYLLFDKGEREPVARAYDRLAQLRARATGHADAFSADADLIRRGESPRGYKPTVPPGAAQ
ncbi:MAG: M56 family metallopeptidase [Acidobacteria bacterium]|nr:M56 family metallopeptidase [Acidobacteriota bacterium]